MTCRRGLLPGRAFTVRAILLCLVNNVREPIKQKPPQQHQQREKNSTTIKTIFKQTNSSSRNIPRHPPRRARPTLSALQCPVLSLSVLIYWRLAHCLGCQKKERKRERKRGGGHGEKESKPGKKAKNKIDRSWIEKKVAHSE